MTTATIPSNMIGSITTDGNSGTCGGLITWIITVPWQRIPFHWSSDS